MRTLLTLIIFLLLCLFPSSLIADGTLQLYSEEAGLPWDLRVDNRELAFEQGMVIYLAEGLHRVEAYLQGYQMIDEPVRITEGERSEVLLERTLPGIAVGEGTRVLAAAPAGDTRLVVTASDPDTAFSFDGTPWIAPAEIPVTAGDYTIHAGSRSWDLEIESEQSVVVRIDPSSSRMRQVTLSADQYQRLSEGRSYDELFASGYRWYGLWGSWSVRNSLIVIGLFLLLLCLLIWRFSLGGRVTAAIMGRRRKARAVRRLMKGDPKGRMPSAARSLQARIDALSGLDELLQRRIGRDRETFEKHRDDQSTKGLKQLGRTRKRLKRLIRLKKRIRKQEGSHEEAV